MQLGPLWHYHETWLLEMGPLAPLWTSERYSLRRKVCISNELVVGVLAVVRLGEVLQRRSFAAFGAGLEAGYGRDGLSEKTTERGVGQNHAWLQK